MPNKVFILLCFCLAACGEQKIVPSSDVEIGEVYEIYELELDNEQQSIRYQASFYREDSGIAIQLVFPESIEAEASSLREVFSNGRPSYTLTAESESRTSFEIQLIWREQSNLIRSFVFETPLIQNLPENINRQESLEISWNPPLEANQSMQVVIKDSQNFQITERTQNEGDTSIVFPAESFLVLAAGLLRIQLIFSSNTTLNSDETFGGEIRQIFRSRYSNLNLLSAPLARQF